MAETALAARTGTRDNFSKNVIVLVAGEVQYRCSSPSCGTPTIGPSDETGKLTRIGVAAHITAAARGGPRYDDSLTKEQRGGASNAIWLCQSCGKAVDDDKSLHTVEELLRWKRDTIALARRALAKRDFDPDGLRRHAKFTHHEVASRVLRAAVATRQAIFRGVRVASANRAPVEKKSPRLVAIRKELDGWVAEIEGCQRELTALMLDLRTHWGTGVPVRTDVIRLQVRANKWRHRVGEKLYQVRVGKLLRNESSTEKWRWDAVFDGDSVHCDLMREGLDANVAAIEAWAKPHMATRQSEDS